MYKRQPLGNAALGDILSLPPEEVSADDLERSNAVPLARSLPHAALLAAIGLCIVTGAALL